uniref:Secreted protein n=1 Tax=Globodera rostochiensis TaxID=31243 RepID=A0A914HDX3_GLORO
MALYIINSLVWFVFFFRYRILLYTYKHSCDFLSPVWMVPIFLGPPKLYSVAYPCFHFAITFERFRSTFLTQKYEHMGTRLIVKIIFTISKRFADTTAQQDVTT